MKDAMIDFETFGNGKNACVVQVGACYFDRDTGAIGETFKMNIDARSAVESGATLDADTVYWWLSQSPEAIASVTAAPLLPIFEVFTHLNLFLLHAETIWSHLSFDFVILAETLRRLKIKPAFSYKAARDIRTLNDLSKNNPKDYERKGLHHDALADAIFQVEYCCGAFKRLYEKK